MKTRLLQYLEVIGQLNFLDALRQGPSDKICSGILLFFAWFDRHRQKKTALNKIQIIRREPRLEELMEDPMMGLLWRRDGLEPRRARQTLRELQAMVQAGR